MADRHQLPHESSSSPPSSLNENDRRLLLLAAVSQSQREQMMGLGTTQPKKEAPSHALILKKESPCTSHGNAAAAASKNTAARDAASGVAPSQKHDTLEATAATNTAAGPTAVTSYENGIPPLNTSNEEPLPPVTTQKMKRKVSECTRDATSCGGRLRALSETVMSAPNSLPAFSAPPLKGIVSGPHQGSNVVVGGTLPMQMVGHDYHQQIMSMSLAGLSAPNNMMLPMQAGPQPQQMQIMQHQQMTTEQKDDGPLKKKRRRKKKDSNSRASKTTAQDVPKPKPAATKDGKPIVFPNQELYSQMLQMKSLKSPPQAAETLAAHIAPLYSRWKEDKTAIAPSSQWESSLSVQKTAGGESYQEDPLKIQSRFLEKEMALNREHQEKQLQKYLSQQQQQQRQWRCTMDVSSEAQMSPMIMCQQHLSFSNPHLSPLPPLSIPGQVAQQHYLQRFLQDVENRAFFNHPSNQQRIMELRHEAVMLEEQMRLREMDFMREHRHMVDLETVNRLRLQADLLEKQLMM